MLELLWLLIKIAIPVAICFLISPTLGWTFLLSGIAIAILILIFKNKKKNKK